MTGTGKYIIRRKEDFVYSNDFLLCVILIDRVLNKNTNLGTILNIYKMLNVNPIKYLVYNRALEYFRKYKKFDINDKLKNKIVHFINLYRIVQKMNKDELELKLDEMLSSYKKDYLLLALIKDILSNNFYETTFKFLFETEEVFSFQKDSEYILNEALVLPKNSNGDISSILNNNFEKQMAEALYITKLEDLVDSPSKNLKLVYYHKLNELEKIIIDHSNNEKIDILIENDNLNVSRDFEYDLGKIKNIILGKISNKGLEIVLQRNDITNKSKTLEEIGNSYSLTRERVRQIEKKTINNLKYRKRDFIDTVDNLLAHLMNDKIYIYVEDLVQVLKDNELTGLIKIIISTNLSLHFKFNEELGIIFIDGLLKEEIDSTLSKFSYVISTKVYQLSSQFEKKLINVHYRLIKENVFLKTGYNTADIYCFIIDKILPDGFKDCEEHLNKIYRYIDENFPDMEYPTGHAILANLERKDYILIDKGTYRHKSKCVELPSILLEKIISYIIDSSSTLYYSSIYDRFKKELNNYGINNRYYLKGILDPKLPKEVKTKRDYLCSSDEFITSRESLSSAIKRKNDKFNIESLKKEFPGVKEYVLMNAILNEGFISIDFGKVFILKKSINLSSDFYHILKKEISSLFLKANSKIISTRKLFPILKIMHKDLMERNPVIQNQYALFSILQYLFEGEYYFRRPYIALEESKLDKESILDDYITTLQKFNYKMLNNYVDKIGLGAIGNYLDLLIDKSEEFVQISMDTAVRKEFILMDENIKVRIKKEIDFFINSFGQIDTTSFYVFNSFPKINYQWNKYLLVGIIRTYFPADYDIKYTNSQFTLTDFIIRRF